MLDTSHSLELCVALIAAISNRARWLVKAGRTYDRLQAIEESYGFCFPSDLRAFLAHALPTYNNGDDIPKWADWREQQPGLLQEQLDWPLDGMCFDIETSDFWLQAWGERPQDLQECFEIARRAVTAAPFLIPICGHRYMPSLPAKAGNPVFSVYQTDIIIYGVDLQDYLTNEFPTSFAGSGPEARRIDFWSALAGLDAERDD